MYLFIRVLVDIMVPDDDCILELKHNIFENCKIVPPFPGLLLIDNYSYRQPAFHIEKCNQHKIYLGQHNGVLTCITVLIY